MPDVSNVHHAQRRPSDQAIAEFDDMQALVRFGHGHLKESRFLLLTITNRNAAGIWLAQQQFSSARSDGELPDTAMQIAFSHAGLKTLGLSDDVLHQFSEEFIVGMSADESRSRRLGDVAHNDPEHWQWGHTDRQQLHVLLLLYARSDAMNSLYSQIVDASFERAFGILRTLPTSALTPFEPFGFVDGISQPKIDWTQAQRTDVHARSSYSNLLAPGEVVLGYPNEYGQITRRPLIDEQSSPGNTLLPAALDHPALLDFGRNGSYLIIRQLHQDVAGFWQFVNETCSHDRAAAADLASAMVGRKQNGEPLVPESSQAIPGIEPADKHNHFDFDQDPIGLHCPIGSHIRRSNPRTGDFPSGVSGLLSRLIRSLGFGRRSEHEDLIASTRFHRILRRGRAYTNPRDENDAGLQFVCLAGNILRQFEFVQSAWLASSSFAGTKEQQDPLLGSRVPRSDQIRTDSFLQADARGPQRKTASLPEFVRVRGGGYFFMPGLQAIDYVAHIANQESGQ